MINLAHNGTSVRAYALVWLTAACGSAPLSPANGAAGPEATAVTASSTVGHALESAGKNAVSGRGSQVPNVSGAAGAAAVAGAAADPAPDQQRQLGFHERFEGDVIVVDVTDSAGSGIFMQGCSSPTGLYQLADEAWIPVKDDRPPSAGHGGYYLDDEYIAPGSETCDATRCNRFPSDTRIEVGETYEYVNAGTRAAPQDASGISRQVPNITRRPLSGAVKIKISYFEDGACQQLSGIESQVEIPVPSKGVCCPIGLAQCSSAGPGGGWAPTVDQCAPFSQSFDAAFQQRNDPRGCPQLVEDDQVCCGCADADGGVGAP
jgi:hypothetical protein